MKRAQRPRPLAGLFSAPVAIAAVCVALLPAAAMASEGGLQILPELPHRGVAEALGMPYGFKWVGLMALFALLVVPVQQLVFKPLFRALDARAERIDGTRARARRLEEEAERILQRYEASVRATREESERARRGRLEEARAASQRAAAEARAEAERRIAEARAELASSLDEARAALRAEAEGLARQAASQVLGRAL